MRETFSPAAGEAEKLGRNDEAASSLSRDGVSIVCPNEDVAAAFVQPKVRFVDSLLLLRPLELRRVA